MAAPRAVFVVLSLFGVQPSVHASTFLHKYVSLEDVEQTLSKLSLVSNSHDILSIENDLRPMFTALPKNSWGNLQPSVVRYALHRFFVQKHGWYMNGLDPNGAAWTSEGATTILTERAPAFIQSVFEERLHGRGMGLSDLAVFASAMSELVQREAIKDVHEIYSALRLPVYGDVTTFWSEWAIKAYLMVYLIGGHEVGTSLEQLEESERDAIETYPDWGNTYMWVQDLRKARDLEQRSRRNPFVRHSASFDSEVRFVQELGHRFGSFQDLECKALKNRLVDMEHQGSGRIRLGSFYTGGLSGDWTLTERVDYLRHLGVLDETVPSRPTVVITNYIQSQSKCFQGSGFYSVCCFNECEGLLRHLEGEIASPSADPKRIAALVANLESDTVVAPRNLSAVLIGRLDAISRYHGGTVPLHGRLFAQWMHHAYPRECPFPHVAGTTTPMNPDDWMDHHGIDDVEATREEMQWHYNQKDKDSEVMIELPWTDVEELVHEHEHGETTWARRFGSLRVLIGLVLLASSPLGFMRFDRAAVAPATSLPKHGGVLV